MYGRGNPTCLYSCVILCRIGTLFSCYQCAEWHLLRVFVKTRFFIFFFLFFECFFMSIMLRYLQVLSCFDLLHNKSLYVYEFSILIFIFVPYPLFFKSYHQYWRLSFLLSVAPPVYPRYTIKSSTTTRVLVRKVIRKIRPLSGHM